MPRSAKLLFAVLLIALAAAAPAQASLGAGQFTQHTLAGHNYFVYQPPGYTGGAAVPLVVYLHGCTQTGPDAAVGTRWNEQADSTGFLVLYPEQTVAANAARCWNWTDPANQSRGAGEAKLIADMTQAVLSGWNVDRQRVFLLGSSAGGAMAMVMGATYPDLYAAIGNFAGCGYGTCSDASGQGAYQAMGPRARPVPAIIGAGTADPTWFGVSTAVQQWLSTSDLADDGQANGSVPRTPASTQNVPGDTNAYPYTVQNYNDRAGRTLITFGTVYGAGHAYLGGDPAGSATDPKGPALTPLAWGFFAQHPMS